MIAINYYNNTKSPITRALFAPLLRPAWLQLVKDKRVSKNQEWVIEIALVGTRTITQLNTRYHNKPFPTDVISLSYFQEYFEKGSNKGRMAEIAFDHLAGEIFISLPYARAQAKKIHQSLFQELQFLFIHGLLHVFGYDHMNPRDEKHMLKLTYVILGRK